MRVLFILLLVTIISCNTKEKKRILGPENLSLQTFQVDPMMDTTIITNGHCKIFIRRGTFENIGNVNLLVREALTLTDMLHAGLTTVAAFSTLKSGGMIFIQAKQKDSVPEILRPIEISLPTDNYNPAMKLFTGKQTPNGSWNWSNPQLPLDLKELDFVATGKGLFNACASCHLIDKALTGPPLAFVTERRCMEWLKKAVRDPAALAKSDACFGSQLKSFATPMTSFPSLSDRDIEAIFSYVRVESEAYRERADSFDPCNGLVSKTTIGKIDKGAGTENKRIMRGPGDSSVDSTEAVSPKETHKPGEYYTFTITTFGWYNLDCYVAPGKFVERSELSATVTGDQGADVYLIIPSEKIVVKGAKNASGKFTFDEGSDSIYLPQQKTGFIVAFSGDANNASFGKSKFTTSKQQDLSLTMQVNADIATEISAMNLHNFEVEIDHFQAAKKHSLNEQLYETECPDNRRDRAGRSK